MTHTEIELPSKPQVTEKTIYDNVPLPAMLMMWHSPVVFPRWEMLRQMFYPVC